MDIDKIQEYLNHHRIALYAILGFLVLFTYLLISVSKQVTDNEAMTTSSHAYEGGLAYQHVLEMQQNSANSQGDSASNASSAQGCYTIDSFKSSGGYVGKQSCNFALSCKALQSGKTINQLKDAIDSALGSFGISGGCSFDETLMTVKCASSKRSCSGFQPTLEKLIQQYCAEPGQTYCIKPVASTGVTPQAEVSPAAAPQISPAAAAPLTCADIQVVSSSKYAGNRGDQSGKCANISDPQMLTAYAYCKLGNKSFQCGIVGHGGSCVRLADLTDDTLKAACCACSSGKLNYQIP